MSSSFFRSKFLVLKKCHVNSLFSGRWRHMCSYYLSGFSMSRLNDFLQEWVGTFNPCMHLRLCSYNCRHGDSLLNIWNVCMKLPLTLSAMVPDSIRYLILWEYNYEISYNPKIISVWIVDGYCFSLYTFVIARRMTLKGKTPICNLSTEFSSEYITSNAIDRS